MGRDRAAYMREYRARKATKVVDMTTTPGRIGAAFDIVNADMRIVELEAEVARLKRELSQRPAYADLPGRFNSRPFTPVPKKGK